MQLKTKLIVGALGLYLASWAAVTGLLLAFETASTGLHRRAAELGGKHASLPTATMKPLKQACAGKLAAGGARAIVGYTAKMEPSKLPALPETYMHVDQTLLGVELCNLTAQNVGWRAE